MQHDWVRVPCSIIRGGTSKAIFLNEGDVPPAGPERDAFISRLYGSPDVRQIDGLGGANSLTSKLALISPSLREDAEIDYTFGQVAIDKPVIDWNGNCGNISSAVGLYAVDQGLVKPEEPFTTVRVYNTNTRKRILVTVPVRDGKTIIEGDYMVPGVPFPGAKILVEFENPEGSVTGKLLPTGKPKDVVDLGKKGRFTYSFVDAGNPVIFLLAEELGLDGTELPEDLEKRAELLELIEEIRGIVSEEVGLVSSASEAANVSPAIPKIGFVTAPKDYVSTVGERVKREQVDVVARLASMQKMHRAYMVTGAVCTTVASRVEGTLLSDFLDDEAKKREDYIIGQPYGPMDVTIKEEKDTSGEVVRRVGVNRTARRIMEGYAFMPKRFFG